MEATNGYHQQRRDDLDICSQDTPPHCLASERGVIGSLLRDPSRLLGVLEVCSPGDMYDPTNADIMAAIIAITAEGRAVDTASVTLWIVEHKGADFAPTAGLLAEIGYQTVTAAHALHFARIVRERSQAREGRRTILDLARLSANGATTGEMAAMALERFGTIGAAVKGPILKGITCTELAERDEQPHYLVESLLVDGQPCIVAGASKAGKTTIACDLSIGLATGLPVLDTFAVPNAVNVLLMSGESGPATIRETLTRQASFRGVRLRDIDRLVYYDSVPQLGDAMHLAALRREIRARDARVVIVDPSYLAINCDRPEDMFAMGRILRGPAEVCRDENATLVLVHHTKKRGGVGTQDRFAPVELDEIAWSGFSQFARQWILLGRRERYEPGSNQHRLWLTAGGSAGHSGCWALDIDERRHGFGGRGWSVTVGTAQEARSGVEEQRAAAQEARRAEQVTADKAAIVKAVSKLPDHRGTKTDIRAKSRRNGQAFGVAFDELLDDGSIEPCQIVKGKRKFDAYKLSDVGE